MSSKLFLFYGLRAYRGLFLLGVILFFSLDAAAESSFSRGQDLYTDPPFWKTEKTPTKLVKRYERRLPSFKAMDIDLDGKLNEDEIDKALLKEFKSHDQDQSASWDANEISGLREEFSEERQAFGNHSDDRIRRFDMRLRKADDNENSILTWDEFYKYFRSRYYLMDQNENKAVEFTEYRMIDDRVSQKGAKIPSKIEAPDYNVDITVGGDDMKDRNY